MRSYHMMWVATLVVLFSLYTPLTGSAYLLRAEERNVNQLGVMQKPQCQRSAYKHIQPHRMDSDSVVAKDETAGLKNGETRHETLTTKGNNDYHDSDTITVSDTNDETAALWHGQLLPHRSYDENYDVAIVKTHTQPVAQSRHNEFGESHEGVVFDGDDDTKESAEKINAHPLNRKRRGLADWFIAPHTHWCGRGNTANGTYNQLGGASYADRCCRRHDHCQVYISAFSSRYEFFNYRPYTLSHCNCDRRFRTCLKMANDDTSNTIGKLFFNMVPSQCIVLREEHFCLKRDAEGNCIKETTRKRAELRDNPKY